MKALKIVGIVLGILLLLTGTGLLAGSFLVNKGENAFEDELAKSGYAGPVKGTVKSVDQTSSAIVTVRYTDTQGNTHTGQGEAIIDKPPEIGATVPTYYDTSDPSQIVVVNVPGLGNLGAIAAGLRTGGIICLIAGGFVLLAGVLGLALGKKSPAAVAAPVYAPGPPEQAPAGYPMQPYPPQFPGQPYPPQQSPGQPYPPQQSPSQPYPPQQNPPQR